MQRMKARVTHECTRFFQKEIQDAIASGDFARCKEVLEEMSKVGKGFTPVASQRKE